MSTQPVGVSVSCGRSVWLTEGYTLYLRWQTGLGPLGRCAVVGPDGTETDLADGPVSPDGDAAAVRPVYAGDGYRTGQCGLRTRNVTPGVGDWTLRAEAADGRRHDRDTSRVTCNGKRDQYYVINIINACR